MINPAELDLKEESVIRINRVAKVNSRGKRFSFSTLVAIGDGKSYVGIAIGCTGGKHRSVVMAEEVSKWLKSENNDAVVLHRDMKEA